MTAKEWTDALRLAIDAFQRANSTDTTQVHLRLADGEVYQALEVEPHPAADLLLIAPYPADLEDLRVGPGTGLPVSPRLILVEPHHIARVELRRPEEDAHPMGFAPPDRSAITWPPEDG
jgi:hypothetical protein